MKFKNILKYAVWSLFAAPLLGLGSCSDEDPAPCFQTEKLVRDLYIPEYMETYVGQQFELQGSGFQQGDLLRFSTDENSVDAVFNEVGRNYGLFTMPAVETKNYALTLLRGGQEQFLGVTSIRLVRHNDVPDKENMNIKGMVFTDDAPVAGVWVSDGTSFAQTDADGCYWLNSDKRHGYVFICVPSGYQPDAVDAMPQFWAPVSASTKRCDQRDFRLTPVNNDKHTLLVTTDYHLANRNSDLDQLKGFMTDIAAVAAAGTEPVYALNLGDLSWDRWWYDANFGLPESQNQLAGMPCPVYSLPGNHDNDPHIAGDFEAEAKYKKVMGPTYYSMNIGKVHYIMLDNIEYINPGASESDRSYNRRFSESELAWLAKDLEHVDKNTPIVVGMHCSVYIINGTGPENYWIGRGLEGREPDFLAYFKGFKTLHIVSGHTHINQTIPISASLGALGADQTIEHNVAAVCGTWWWTRQYTDNHICTDGSPAGYKVFEIDGDRFKWYYKGIGFDRSKMFRTYDMNVVKKYWATDPKVAKFLAVDGYAGHESNYDWAGENTVLINVFSYDPFKKMGWEVTVTEDGKPLETHSVFTHDPLHQLSYEVPRAAAGKALTSDFVTRPTAHMLWVEASSANSTLEITVKDEFGNVSTETMVRPKVFNDQAIN